MAITATLDSLPTTVSSGSTETRKASRVGAVAWTGRGISAFVALFLVVDGGGRVAQFAPYVEGTVKFGIPAYLGVPIGLALVVATLLYVVPRTAVLGAILVTGYLGGAAATQARVEDPWFLFPVVFGMLAWGGLYLRDARVRELLPFRR